MDKLEKSLAVLEHSGLIRIRHSGSIRAGSESEREHTRLMEEAHVILLLVSLEFLASDRCYSNDLAHALERHERGEAHLIPVILRPCPWEDTDFGGLAALPEGGRPVSKWDTQDEGLTNVVKAIRSLVVEGVKVGAPKPTGSLKRDIPRLLPYLCNRTEQEVKLSSIFSAERARLHRPAVCIVHGHEEECHDMFALRLKHNSLPRLLRESAPSRISVHDLLLPFPSSIQNAELGFRRLRDTLAEKVTNRRDATDKEIAKALSCFRSPVLIHTYLSAEAWGSHCPELIDAFIKYWSDFPDLMLTARLFVCLFVIYRGNSTELVQAEPTEASGPNSGSGSARKYISNLDFTAYDGIRGVVLPEMSTVPLVDAENYFRDRFFYEICKYHSPSFCNVQGAVEEIRLYYKKAAHKDAAGHVPLQHLAKELRRVLEKNLC